MENQQSEKFIKMLVEKAMQKYKEYNADITRKGCRGLDPPSRVHQIVILLYSFFVDKKVEGCL